MAVTVEPILDEDLWAVGSFLHDHWPRGDKDPAERWIRTVSPPWQEAAPNHGFMLIDDGLVVGVYLAVYADRVIDGHPERFCNLATWYVLPEYRMHSLKLLKSVLAQDGFHFTDFTPASEVVRINERFKFVELDTTFAMVPGLPYPSAPGRITVSSDPSRIEQSLSGAALDGYLDHIGATGVKHFVIVNGDEACHVMIRRHRIKGIRYFASVLYVSEPRLLMAGVRQLARHLLVHYGVLGTLVELRLVDARPQPSFIMKMNSNRRMFRSRYLEPGQIDYLYSEVTWSGA